MEPTWVTEARRQLALAQAASTPQDSLASSLTAIETLLRRGAPADGQSLATLAMHTQGDDLAKAEVAQVVRLSNVAQRSSMGQPVDPLDAAQAEQLAQALLTRQTPGGLPPQAISPPAPYAPVQEVRYIAPARVAESSRRFPVGAALLVVGGAFLLVLILVLGPLVLALLGPPWVRWLALPVALAVAAFTLWQLFRLTAVSGVIVAALIALMAGVIGGSAWAWGAQQGLMPPLRYFAPFLAPTAAARPVVGDEPSLHVGGQAIVTNTGEIGLRVRAKPGLGMAEVGRLPDGSVVTVVGASESADGLDWWRVQGPGISGWVAATYLQPID
ncbi:MAG: SH3 domain-containing protein [Anaerolineae bacterium]